MDILDTDYDNYMVVYSCQENVEYLDKVGIEVDTELVWKAYLAQSNWNKLDDKPPLYQLSNFENLKGITANPFYK